MQHLRARQELEQDNCLIVTGTVTDLWSGVSKHAADCLDVDWWQRCQETVKIVIEVRDSGPYDEPRVTIEGEQ